MTRRSRGFSLPEILMATVLMGLTLGMGLLVSRAGTEDFTIRGIASQLVADLRFARARAASNGRPVGLFLPGGAVCAQGYAVVEADAKSPGRMRVVQAQDWSALRKGSYVISGRWESLPFSTGPFSGGGRPDPVAESALDSWKESVNGKYLVFSPSGGVVSSDFPRVDGDILLVVAAGCEATGEVLSQVYEESHTIRIRPLGGVSQQAGVPGLEGAEVSNPPPPASVAVLPLLLKEVGSLRTPGNKTPAVSSGLVVHPLANPATLPAGHTPGKTFSVRLDGTVSLRLKATDADGDRLYCRWGAEALGSVPPGTAPAPRGSDETPVPPPVTAGSFSAEGLVPMTWSQADDAWVSAVEWTPPAGAAAGTWYSLGVVVDDLRTDGRVADWIVVRGFSSDRVTYLESRGGSHLAWSLNPDGTDPRCLAVTPFVPGEASSPPTVSPDGQRIAFSSPGDTHQQGVWVAKADGTDPVRISPHRANWLDWSPGGTGLVYAHEGGSCTSSGQCVHRVNADGSANQVLAAPAGRPSWSPDGGRVAFLSPGTPGVDSQIRTCKPDGTDLKTLQPVLPQPLPPAPPLLATCRLLWSPDGSRLAADAPASSTDRSPRVVLFQADGSTLSWPVPRDTPFSTEALGWTPGGLLLYAHGQDGLHAVRPDGTEDQRVSPASGLVYRSGSVHPRTGALLSRAEIQPPAAVPGPTGYYETQTLVLSSPDFGTWQSLLLRPGLDTPWDCLLSRSPFMTPRY